MILFKNMSEKKLKDFDYQHLKDQIYWCEYYIKNGNWNGYADRLAARKEILKERKKELASYGK